MAKGAAEANRLQALAQDRERQRRNKARREAFEEAAKTAPRATIEPKGA